MSLIAGSPSAETLVKIIIPAQILKVYFNNMIYVSFPFQKIVLIKQVVRHGTLCIIQDFITTIPKYYLSFLYEVFFI